MVRDSQHKDLLGLVRYICGAYGEEISRMVWFLTLQDEPWSSFTGVRSAGASVGFAFYLKEPQVLMLVPGVGEWVDLWICLGK